MANDLGPIYALGLDTAKEDFHSKVRRWKGIDPDIEDEIDFDDLALQYVSSPERTSKAMLGIVTAATDAYWAKIGRANVVAKVVRKAVEEKQIAWHPSVEKAWVDGYRMGLDQATFDEVLERSAEMLEEQEEEGAETLGELRERHERERYESENEPTRQNPGGEEPLIPYWSAAGTWDSGHTFDPDTLEEADVDVEDYVERIVDEHGNVEPAKLSATVQVIQNAILEAWREDNFQEDWAEQHEDELAEMKHSPAEAFDAWSKAYVGRGGALIKRWLEKAAAAERRGRR